MKDLISKYVVEPLQGVLKQGLSRQELALTLAVGVVVATFPVFGITTFLCMIVAAFLGLNQVAIQVANYAGYPLQFVLFIPLDQTGGAIVWFASCLNQPCRSCQYALGAPCRIFANLRECDWFGVCSLAGAGCAGYLAFENVGYCCLSQKAQISKLLLRSMMLAISSNCFCSLRLCASCSFRAWRSRMISVLRTSR